MKINCYLIAFVLATMKEAVEAKKNKNDDDGSSSGSHSHYGGSNNNDDSSTGTGSTSSGGSSHYGGSADDNSACTDSYYNCASYVRAGYCPSYFCESCAYPHYCDSSCNYCPSNPVPSPTAHPVHAPTQHPVHAPTQHPIHAPTRHPIPSPTRHPIPSPTRHPIPAPTQRPVHAPTQHPIHAPTRHPIPSPTQHPNPVPTRHPIPAPTRHPIPSPTQHPIHAPTRHPVVDPIPSPTSSPIPRPTAHPIPSPTASPIVTHDGGRTCFSSEDMVTLENGEKLPFAKLSVGDKILTASRDGTIAYSKVVFLPHKENFTPTTFLKFTTERNKEIKLTSNHLVQLCSGRLLAAHLLTLDAKADSCLRTIHEDEQITAIEQVQSNGVYTAVAENEFLVVNGIIASPFAQSAVLAHAFFNITDMEDWCSSHNWMVYENLHHQPLLDVMNAHDTLVTPSEDCMNLLTNMFKKFKHEPVGWGVNGWGYRGWANPASAQKSAHVHSSNQHRNLRLSEAKLQEEAEQVPLAGILSGWD